MAPVLAGYLVVVGCLVAYRRMRREPEPAQTERGSPSRTDFVRYVAMLFLMGFVFFQGIIVVFYFIVSGQSRSIIVHALWQGSVLAFGIVLPAFLLLSWLDQRRRRARQARR